MKLTPGEIIIIVSMLVSIGIAWGVVGTKLNMVSDRLAEIVAALKENTEKYHELEKKTIQNENEIGKIKEHGCGACDKC